MANVEITVVLKQAAKAAAGGVPSAAFESSEPIARLAALVDEYSADLAPTFPEVASSIMFESGDVAVAAPTPVEREMARYLSVVVDTAVADELRAKLASDPRVECVYRAPPIRSPYFGLSELEPRFEGDGIGAPGAPTAIPDYRRRQGYLGASPEGIAVAAAHALEGGLGDGVQIIDIEGGWCLEHVDLTSHGGLASATMIDELGWRDHGTAVLGEMIGDDNGTGVTGICPNALGRVYSHDGIRSATAINAAAALLNPGDILLLEMHQAGPRYNFEDREDQLGLIAMEWWPNDFLAIRAASDRGIIVVEAAGNGAESFDDPIYGIKPADFPATWRNPFAPGHDSGAIIVGAGAPPNTVFGPDRSRLDFSNHGSRVDCQGWGRSVVTTGYGDLFRGVGEPEWYTAGFSGTSSASPIVAGAIACLQGISKARGQLLSPLRARQLLRQTGAPQRDGPNGPASQRIGSRPDLAALLAAI